ncbi:hypothetical protein TRFO_34850 [Tritrichomonas foetus]|uniref:Uncharacterized protein n=1 Tax=Tritrichomonas foetus TaxID=1144522 RepID=A0A1J4JHP2_9EUKA|nr:hypothetical protein TRFO_34850 [Tritrichomonas foetus]|eukprot:OHS98672.1 hypothetical protein TRFO_34850 [Tritrichomonas foetus]
MFDSPFGYNGPKPKRVGSTSSPDRLLPEDRSPRRFSPNNDRNMDTNNFNFLNSFHSQLYDSLINCIHPDETYLINQGCKNSPLSNQKLTRKLKRIQNNQPKSINNANMTHNSLNSARVRTNLTNHTNGNINTGNQTNNTYFINNNSSYPNNAHLSNTYLKYNFGSQCESNQILKSDELRNMFLKRCKNPLKIIKVPDIPSDFYVHPIDWARVHNVVAFCRNKDILFFSPISGYFSRHTGKIHHPTSLSFEVTQPNMLIVGNSTGRIYQIDIREEKLNIGLNSNFESKNNTRSFINRNISNTLNNTTINPNSNDHNNNNNQNHNYDNNRNRNTRNINNNNLISVLNQSNNDLNNAGMFHNINRNDITNVQQTTNNDMLINNSTGDELNDDTNSNNDMNEANPSNNTNNEVNNNANITNANLNNQNHYFLSSSFLSVIRNSPIGGNSDLTVVGDHTGTISILDLRQGGFCHQNTNSGICSKNSSIVDNNVNNNNDCFIIQRKTAAHRMEICNISINPTTGKIASGGNDNTVKIWDIRNMNRPYTCFRGHSAAVRAIAWNPLKSNAIATGGGSNDRTIRIWDVDTRETSSIVQTGSQVCNLYWSRRYYTILSTHGFSQNTIALWRGGDLQNVACFALHKSRVLYTAVSPDEEYALTAAPKDPIYLWNFFASDIPYSHKAMFSLR